MEEEVGVVEEEMVAVDVFVMDEEEVGVVEEEVVEVLVMVVE